MALVGAGQEFSGALAPRRVHPHVERAVEAKREAALGVVDLRRGNAEVEEDAAHLRHAAHEAEVMQSPMPDSLKNFSF